MKKLWLAILTGALTACGHDGSDDDSPQPEVLGVVATLPTPHAGPFGAKLTPDGSKLFVPLFGTYGSEGPGSTLAVFDTATNSLLAEIPVGERPEDVDFTEDGLYAYVTNSNSATVTVLHVPSLSVVDTIPLGKAFDPNTYEGTYPYGIAVRNGQAYVFCSAYGDGNDEHVKVVDTNPASPTFHRKTGGIVLSGVYTRGAFRPGANELVVARGQADNDWAATPQIAIFSTDSGEVLSTIPIQQAPGGFHGMEDLCVTPNGKYAYAASYNSGSGEAEVYVVDLVSRKFQDLVVLDNGDITTHGVGMRPDGLLVGVTSWNLGRVSFLFTPTNTVVYEYETGKNPNEVAFSPDGTRAYVTNQNSHTVTVVALRSTSDLVHRLVLDAIEQGKASAAAAGDLRPRIDALKNPMVTGSQSSLDETVERIRYWASRDELSIGKPKKLDASGAARNGFAVPREGVNAR